MSALMTTQSEDVKVRREDQDQISEFGRLNNRLLEVRAELKQYKSDVEKLDDATAELAMNSADGKVMILIGESFVECTEEFADEYCEKKSEHLQDVIKKLTEEETTISKRQDELKKTLYKRFGDSINLEN